ncbi:hypothetical protein PG994_008224 [Apiospora phragmitis]|uniref:Uncharacterized protein n=1 Tax=Apiospora phragmitis TaxID=2905665 RepID=A0ABR1USG1_9PEZI
MRPVVYGAPEGTPAPIVENQTLEEITRLEVPIWKNQASKFVKIPSAFGWYLVTQAHDIARGAFRGFCETHVSALYRSEFPGGDHEVHLEYTEIEYFLQWPIAPKGSFYSDDYVASALKKTRCLRNACSHFQGQNLNASDFDRYVKYAQTLAVAVDDAPRAARARALREELGQVAAETYDEIESLGCCSILYVQREWEIHHGLYLERVSRSSEDSWIKDEEYALWPLITLAAEAHRLQQESISDD